MRLARSAKPQKNIPAQSYADHVANVYDRAVENAARLSEFCKKDGPSFVDTVSLASEFHDLGKLAPENQKKLASSKGGKLPIPHWDAGVFQVLKNKAAEAALLIYCHHKGLISIPAEATKKEKCFREPDVMPSTDASLETFLKAHYQELNGGKYRISDLKQSPTSNIRLRLGLSCLVDGDHGDAATHTGDEKEYKTPASRWEERLNKLDCYVRELAEKSSEPKRTRQRQEIYNACRNNDEDSGIIACDSPVGTGKTTAVMAYLLCLAISKKLRHIIVVLPYTNIIQQSVDVYRKALVLPGENPEEIVAEHHHQAEFDDYDLRKYTALWKAPIIVTTAVQFFETIAASRPARLRKLHELPGSAVFIDEVHAAIPTFLWPQTWKWIEEYVNSWSCHFILASGSLPQFWTSDKFVENPPKVPDLIPSRIRKNSDAGEKKRVIYRTVDTPFSRKKLMDFVCSKNGPQLLIMNTVQSAAVMARELKNSGHDVLHLSTALTPSDRKIIIKRIRKRLYDTENQDWTLVATSCVEAGVDFSFRTAFRERCSVASLIQIGGRANRNGEYGGVSEIWDFKTSDPLLNRHPGFNHSRKVVEKILEKDLLNLRPVTWTMTEAMRLEIMSQWRDDAEQLVEIEKRRDFPEVNRLYRVIDSDTRLVLIDEDVIEAIETGENLGFQEILRGSVQIWPDKIRYLGLSEIESAPGIYKWSGAYDKDFLGIMEEVLRIMDFESGTANIV